MSSRKSVSSRCVAFAVVVMSVVAGGVANAGAGAVPGGSSAFSASSVARQQRWMAWAFGSETNPLLQDNFCGEKVGDAFFLNAAINPVLEATCTIPRGTPLVASPGGAISWYPTDATTRRGLLAARDEFISHVSDAVASLDGKALDVQRGFATSGVYTIPLAPDSFVKTVDPNTAELTRTRVASAGWILRIPPLRHGSHTLVLSDKIDGVSYTATFHITVTRGSHS